MSNLPRVKGKLSELRVKKGRTLWSKVKMCNMQEMDSTGVPSTKQPSTTSKYRKF